MINQFKRPNSTSLLVFFTVLYLTGLGVVVGSQDNTIGGIVAEVYNIIKLFFVVLLAYFIGENSDYFLSRAEKIFRVNFLVFSANILFGYVTGIGLNTYERLDSSSKGFLDGGNSASILALVFFVYYMFNWGNSNRDKLFVLLAFFNIYIVATKVIFVTPLILGLFLFFKVKWTLKKVAVTIFLVMPLLFYLVILVRPLVIEVFENRYLSTLSRSGLYTSGADYDTNNAFLAYRRIAYSIDQSAYQLGHIPDLLTGIGREGQKEYWGSKSAGMDFAAMDFFDTLFQYGLLGALLIYTLFIKSLRSAWKNGLSNPFSIALFIIFTYSFFGGYVLFSATAGTMLATLVGLHLLTDLKKTPDESSELNLKY